MNGEDVIDWRVTTFDDKSDPRAHHNNSDRVVIDVYYVLRLSTK